VVTKAVPLVKQSERNNVMPVAAPTTQNVHNQIDRVKSRILAHAPNASDSETGDGAGNVEIQTVKPVVMAATTLATAIESNSAKTRQSLTSDL
jgi:hypothetical protein